MTTLVCLSAREGRIARYEGAGGGQARPEKTHAHTWGHSVEFTAPDIERFRVDPPDSLSLGPKPTPTPPNAGAGTAGGGSPANDIETSAVAQRKAA